MSATRALARTEEVATPPAIGHPDPVSVCINTFGTGVVKDEDIERAVAEVFSFKPAAIIKQLNLLLVATAQRLLSGQ